jgi:hypothetical protein
MITVKKEHLGHIFVRQYDHGNDIFS